ncbi:tetratricopeptide repeat protein [Vibrio sp. D431a]|uniref:tetratricopeptide repeat protein n=1 Tax=Vibrio sp. D431a TaxID=2837388 RepID=UPI002555956A|nr:tetratricopeptide repeat protein [Vibrio sp. D431a]MDK9793868.1 sel1 repeat family protein [Vibrio sp. D431a]
MSNIKRLFIAVALFSPAAFASLGEPVDFKKIVEEDKNWTGVQIYKAESAVATGHYDVASSHYLNVINNGLSQAANNVAVLIKEGKLSDDAIKKAIKTIERLAINDVELSAFLGDFYHTHKTLGDDRYAFKWLNNASRLGDVSSKLLVGQYIIEKKGGAHEVYSTIDALTLYKQYIEKTDDPIVTLELGKHLFEGKIVKRDYRIAAELFAKASGAGVLEANYWLGYQHEKGIGVKRNIEAAEQYYLESLGSPMDAEAYYQLARLYMYGDNGTNGDYLLGVDYLKKSYELNNTMAAYRFGIMYLYGTDGFKLDVNAGVRYLEEASNAGYKLATQKLIDVFRNGVNGVVPSHSKVREYEKRLKDNK